MNMKMNETNVEKRKAKKVYILTDYLIIVNNILTFQTKWICLKTMLVVNVSIQLSQVAYSDIKKMTAMD